MRSYYICPSAIAKKWYDYRQSPQEEYDRVRKMDYHYRCDRDKALRTSNAVFLRPSLTNCTNFTMNMNQVSTFYDYYRKAIVLQSQQEQQNQMGDKAFFTVGTFLGGTTWQQYYSENLTDDTGSKDPNHTTPISSPL